MKTHTLTAILHKEDYMYVAENPETGVASQGKGLDEAVANLKEAVELYLEEFPLEEESKPVMTVFEVSEHGKVAEAVRQ